MTLLEKINNLTWYDLINKLKDILKGLNDKPSGGYEPPYKVYTALLTQSGTDAPVATVLENTLGFTPVWSRERAGTYTILAPQVANNNLTKNNTYLTIQGSIRRFSIGLFNDGEGDVITYYTLDNTNTHVDGSLANIEIKVYS